MADLSTTTYGWVKPTVGADKDVWGGITNTNWDSVDHVVSSVASGVTSVSSSLGVVAIVLGAVSSSLVGVSSSLTAATTSLSQLSSSLSTTNVAVAANASSLSAVSSSLTGVSSSVAGLSGSVSGLSASTSQISASLSGVTSSLTNVSASVATVSSSLVNVSASTANLSASLSQTRTSVANVSTSLAAMPQAGTAPTSVGYLGLPLTSFATNQTLTLANLGTELFFTANATLTIPAHGSLASIPGSFFKASAANGVVLTIALTTDTLVLESSGAVGARTVTGRGHAVVTQETNTEWWASGVNCT